jgi:hypothetical protein
MVLLMKNLIAIEADKLKVGTKVYFVRIKEKGGITAEVKSGLVSAVYENYLDKYGLHYGIQALPKGISHAYASNRLFTDREKAVAYGRERLEKQIANIQAALDALR